MSLQFSDTTNKQGIIQQIERYTGLGYTGITGNSDLLKYFTSEVNLAANEVWATIFEIGGTWQWDDSNHPDFPEITTNIVSDQRDYTFTEDERGNLILEIHKIFVADENGLFRQLTPTDVPSGSPSNYWDGLNTQGQPNTYDKKGNSILLDPIPNYNYTDGLKVQISREGVYFSSTDTTETPGFAGLFHDYLALKPSYVYARDNRLVNKDDLLGDSLKMKLAIENFYKAREKDVQKVLRPKINNSR